MKTCALPIFLAAALFAAPVAVPEACLPEGIVCDLPAVVADDGRIACLTGTVSRFRGARLIDADLSASTILFAPYTAILEYRLGQRLLSLSANRDRTRFWAVIRHEMGLDLDTGDPLSFRFTLHCHDGLADSSTPLDDHFYSAETIPEARLTLRLTPNAKATNALRHGGGLPPAYGALVGPFLDADDLDLPDDLGNAYAFADAARCLFYLADAGDHLEIRRHSIDTAATETIVHLDLTYPLPTLACPANGTAVVGCDGEDLLLIQHDREADTWRITTPLPATLQGASAPVCSPDGRFVAFLAANTAWLLDHWDSSLTRLSQGIDAPCRTIAISPGARFAAFHTDSALWRVALTPAPLPTYAISLSELLSITTPPPRGDALAARWRNALRGCWRHLAPNTWHLLSLPADADIATLLHALQADAVWLWQGTRYHRHTNGILPAGTGFWVKTGVPISGATLTLTPVLERTAPVGTLAGPLLNEPAPEAPAYTPDGGVWTTPASWKTGQACYLPPL